MKKLMVTAALLAAVSAQPALAASANCYSASAIEADQAIRYMTDLMVVSSTCQDTVYAEFRLRNRDAILAYQKAMIAHFHGSKQFDSWNTTLANQASQKTAGQPSAQVCQNSSAMLATAKSLDSMGFRKYAASQAAAAGTNYKKCGK